MRAVWLNEFGGPGGAGGRRRAGAGTGPGQALVDVVFANLTFVETQFRATGAGPFEAELPMIPGNGVGGAVSALGRGSTSGCSAAGGHQHGAGPGATPSGWRSTPPSSSRCPTGSRSTTPSRCSPTGAPRPC
jgi:hypothetical protein